MNTKTKKFTWTSLAYALVLILLATTMVGIVAYAAGSKTHNIGGNVTFSADGVEATVEATGWEGCTIGGESYSAGQTVLSTITYSTDISTKSDMESAVESWEDMQIVITNTDGITTTGGDTLSAGEATLTFTVTNNFSDSAIEVTIGTISVTNTQSNTISITSNVEEAQEIEAGKSFDFVITFKTSSPDYNATISDFTIPVTIEKVNGHTATVNITYTSDVGMEWWHLETDTGEQQGDEAVYGGHSDGQTYTFVYKHVRYINIYGRSIELTSQSASANKISANASDLRSFTLSYTDSNVTYSYTVGNCTSYGTEALLLTITLTEDITINIY